MISFEELERYLPRYLSDTSQNNLFEELKIFPENIDQRIYSSHLTTDAIIYQGDGLNGLMVINLPHPEIKRLPALVLSNTCDIELVGVEIYLSEILKAKVDLIPREDIREELKESIFKEIVNV